MGAPWDGGSSKEGAKACTARRRNAHWPLCKEGGAGESPEGVIEKAEEGLKRLKWDNVMSRQLPRASNAAYVGPPTISSGWVAPTKTLQYSLGYHLLDVQVPNTGTSCTPELQHRQ